MMEVQVKVYNNTESSDNSKGAETTLLSDTNDEAVCEMDNVPHQKEQDVNMIKKLNYRTGDNPPIHITILLALQNMLLALPLCLGMAMLVAEFVCAEDDQNFKAMMLSTTMVLTGITTLAQVTVGVRLPLYQGPSMFSVIPLLNLKDLPEYSCPTLGESLLASNMTMSANLSQLNGTDSVLHYREHVILPRIQSTIGCLALVGLIQMIGGLSGVTGLVMRFIGPLTIVPALMLVGLNAFQFITKFCQSHWGITSITGSTALILSVYLNGRRMPIPMWTPRKKWHTIKYPLHQVLAILLAVLVGWIVSAILTETGLLSNDKTSVQYTARTDARNYVILKTPWFYFPYPGQFGSPDFSGGLFIAFITSTILSITDSIADYHLCANIVRVPPPPIHAINRGLIIEGFFSIVSGFFGASHATTTFADFIGLIGITKVASRSVFMAFACLLILFGIIGKFAAVLITIPYPVLGGILIISFGMFFGLVLSNLQYVDINSTRNLAVIGMSTLLGLMLPFWIKENPNGIKTGSIDADNFLRIVLSNPFFIGILSACLLDNTLPGTMEERGMNAWGKFGPVESKGDNLHTEYEEGYEVYELTFLSSLLKERSWTRFVPFLPTYNPNKIKCCRRRDV